MVRSDTRFDREVRHLRARQIRRILRRSWSSVPGARRSMEILGLCFRRNDERTRSRLLGSPLLAGWIRDVLFWLAVRDLAEALRSRPRDAGLEPALFDEISRTEYLVELVPSGRLDPGFGARVRRRALRVLWERVTDLPRILLPYLPTSSGSLEIPLFFRELPEEGCPGNRIRLGEAPVWIAWKDGPPPMALKAAVVGHSLVIAAPVQVEPHETIPGTGILLARRLVSGPRSMRVGGPVRGLARRMQRALGLVKGAWPRAAREIGERTWLVVPLVEAGTVSYSHLARPGISYINVFRGSLLHLADDLLHETAHHRLHARQETDPLVRDDGEPLYFSPWRRTSRPLIGILHGTFTFLYRAELFLRMSRVASRPGGDVGLKPASRHRPWLEREARRELLNCGSALVVLEQARGERRLTPAGSALVGRMRRRLTLLSRDRLSPASRSGIL